MIAGCQTSLVPQTLGQQNPLGELNENADFQAAHQHFQRMGPRDLYFKCCASDSDESPGLGTAAKAENPPAETIQISWKWVGVR